MARRVIKVLATVVKRSLPPSGGTDPVDPDPTEFWGFSNMVYHDISSASWGDYTIRLRLEPSSFNFGGSKTRLTFSAAANSKTQVTKVFVGNADGSTYNFTTAPIEVLFGGTSGFLLNEGQEITSDEINLPYDPATSPAMIVSLYVPNVSGNDNLSAVNAAGRSGRRGEFTVDSAGNTLSGSVSSTFYSSYALSGVEFLTDSFAEEPEWNVAQEPVLNITSPGWDGFTLRTSISSSVLPSSTTKIRLVLRAQASAGAVVHKMFLGLKSGDYQFTESPQPVLFSGNPVMTLSAGQEITSDIIDLDYDAFEDEGLMFSWYVNPGEPLDTYLARTSQTGWASFFRSGDHAVSIPATGFSSNTRSVVAIQRIEFLSENSRITSVWVGAVE